MSTKNLSYEEIASVCSGMGMLIHAGTGTADALALVAADMDGTPLKGILDHMAEEADNGVPLVEVCEEEGCVPSHVTALLEVGERTGHTEETFESLASYYESRSRMSRQIRDALIYPMTLMIIMIVVVAVLLAYVLPIFNDVYRQLGGRLTGVAGGLFAVGQVISRIMPVLCVLLLAVAVFVIAFAVSESFRDKCLGFWRKRRGDRGLSWQVSSSHFAQAFSMGVSSGMQIEEAVELSGKLLEGVPGAQTKCKDCLNLLMDGTSVSDALKQTNLLPQAECRLLKTAVRSGTTDTCISEIADRMSWKSERAIQQTVSRIEPTLVIVGCVLVGLILFSVMLPLMNIMSSMG